LQEIPHNTHSLVAVLDVRSHWGRIYLHRALGSTALPPRKAATLAIYIDATHSQMIERVILGADGVQNAPKLHPIVPIYCRQIIP